MDKTKIAWTDATWNPLRGCSRVSAGCEHCYAEGQAHRFSGPGLAFEGLTVAGPKGPRWTGKIKLVPEKLAEPLHWRKPRRIFVNSMSDLFHENVPDEYIDRVFAAMSQAWHHTFQVLTKRPERMRNWFTCADRHLATTRCFRNFTDYTEPVGPWPLPNVHLGVSVENQAAADERIPLLLETPAAVRFVSAEPLLGAVNICAVPDSACRPAMFSALYSPLGDLDWIIVGGESGPGARPMNEDWVRSIRDQCVEAGVAFFYKQKVENGKKIEMPELDGRTWEQFPTPPPNSRSGGRGG